MNSYIEFLRSSTFLLSINNCKVLFDPWLEDGEYYGSWSHFPPEKIDYSEMDDLDLICLTHIHPDHFSKKTFNKLNRKIPVLISNYKQKFLKINLEKLGFVVIEINHEQYFEFNGLKIYSYAADNCDPELCMKFFGCGFFGQKENSSNQIDSIFLLEFDNKVILNTNDVPYNLAINVLKKIKSKFHKIDILFTGYAGAGPYPQCFENLTKTEKLSESHKKKTSFLEQSLKYIYFFNPSFFIPFAGTYYLSGKYCSLNKFRGVPEIEEALNYIQKKTESKGILFSYKKKLNLKDFSEINNPLNKLHSKNINELKHFYESKKMDYEDLKMPSTDDLLLIFDKCYDRFEVQRKAIDFKSKTKIYLSLSDKIYIEFSADGSGFKKIMSNEIDYDDQILIMKLDPRLLMEILKGPKYAHWNNAEIGSHISYYRNPNLYERGLFYCLNFLHS